MTNYYGIFLIDHRVPLTSIDRLLFVDYSSLTLSIALLPGTWYGMITFIDISITKVGESTKSQKSVQYASNAKR
jgi:hypothetical protein